MQTLQIVCIRDVKTDAYSAPQFILSIGGWLRGVGDVVNGEQNNDLAKHPEDFEAFHLGTWNDVSGTFELNPEGPRSLGPLENFVTTK